MKTAIITGGSRGIGYGIAEALIREGTWNIAITGRSQDILDRALAGLDNIAPEKSMGRVCDVRDYSAQEKFASEAVAKFGSIDLLVANAGIGHFAPVDSITIEQWQETIDTNLTGVFFSLKACLAELIKSKGYFITISSLAGTNFFANGSAYNASKFGLTGFTQAAMLDLRKYGIRSTTIMPGSVATDFGGNMHNSDESWKIQIEDIGQMVADLMKIHPRTLPSKIEVRPTVPK
jgi:NAD(P)-dependent dehydrogenase (short-subunit alcohol dehydrogenase family)